MRYRRETWWKQECPLSLSFLLPSAGPLLVSLSIRSPISIRQISQTSAIHLEVWITSPRNQKEFWGRRKKERWRREKTKCRSWDEEEGVTYKISFSISTISIFLHQERERINCSTKFRTFFKKETFLQEIEVPSKKNGWNDFQLFILLSVRKKFKEKRKSFLLKNL